MILKHSLSIFSSLCTVALFAISPVAAQPTATPPLEQIVVTASLIDQPRTRIGAAVTVLTADQIRMRGYDSLADLLRTQPAVSVSNSGGAGKATALRIRGEEGYRTLLLIDGVKTADPTGTQIGPAFSNLLTTSDVARVEILRGPQGFMYGADAGGVVNVITKTGRGRPAVRIGLESGSFGTSEYDLSVSGGGDKLDYFVSASDFRTDGFNTRTDDTVLRDADGARNTTRHAKIGWQVSDSLRVQLVARDIDAWTASDGCFSPLSFATTHACTGDSEQQTARLSANWTAGGFSHSIGYGEVTTSRLDLADGTESFRADGGIGRFEYTGSARLDRITTIVFGVDLQDESIDGTDGRTRRQDAAYFEYQSTPLENLYLSAGLRRDDNEDFGTHTSARLSASFAQPLSDSATLRYRSSFGTGFRAPSLYEAAYNRGPFAFPPAAGIELAEESSKGIDIGIEYERSSGARVGITWFDQRIDDEIVFDLIGFSGYEQSPGTSRSTGFELDFSIPAGDRIEMLGNVTLNDTEDATGSQRLRRPETLANLGLSYQAPDERVRLLANYRVSHNAVDIGATPLDDYGVLDLSIRYRIRDSLELHGRLENALDENYQEILGFNTAGRSALVGIALQF